MLHDLGGWLGNCVTCLGKQEVGYVSILLHVPSWMSETELLCTLCTACPSWYPRIWWRGTSVHESRGLAHWVEMRSVGTGNWVAAALSSSPSSQAEIATETTYSNNVTVLTTYVSNSTLLLPATIAVPILKLYADSVEKLWNQFWGGAGVKCKHSTV